ncbi:MAG: sugar nucleotide-binding protein [Candidatus Aminicenantes bacterium]|nr:sugar nucleotide-binding protein [Candidatus Aminicenantes bacterium]
MSGYKSKVIPVKSEEFEQPAKRPRNSVLDLTMTKLVLEEDLPSWKKSLEKFLTEIEFNQKDEK